MAPVGSIVMSEIALLQHAAGAALHTHAASRFQSKQHVTLWDFPAGISSESSNSVASTEDALRLCSIAASMKQELELTVSA